MLCCSQGWPIFVSVSDTFLGQEGDWEQRYEFVWALDSDIDLSKASRFHGRRWGRCKQILHVQGVGTFIQAIELPVSFSHRKGTRDSRLGTTVACVCRQSPEGHVGVLGDDVILWGHGQMRQVVHTQCLSLQGISRLRCLWQPFVPRTLITRSFLFFATIGKT